MPAENTLGVHEPFKRMAIVMVISDQRFEGAKHRTLECPSVPWFEGAWLRTPIP